MFRIIKTTRSSKDGYPMQIGKDTTIIPALPKRCSNKAGIEKAKMQLMWAAIEQVETSNYIKGKTVTLEKRDELIKYWLKDGSFVEVNFADGGIGLAYFDERRKVGCKA